MEHQTFFSKDNPFETLPFVISVGEEHITERCT
jgi:hypothetical protein